MLYVVDYTMHWKFEYGEDATKSHTQNTTCTTWEKAEDKGNKLAIFQVFNQKPWVSEEAVVTCGS